MSTRALKRKSSVSHRLPKQKKIATKEEIFKVEPKLQRNTGTVMVFGDGVCSQLGLGPDVTEKTRPALIAELNNIIELAVGGMHTVCITSDFKVVTFGCNDEGALGRDTSEESSEASPGEVDIPAKIVQVSAGDSHSSALTETGQVYVWGTFRGTNGPLGILNSREILKRPTLVDAKINFTRIASGAHHLVLIGENKQIYTCGCGEQGQLGRIAERNCAGDSRKGLDQLLMPDIVPFKKGFQGVDIWTGSYGTFVKDSKGQIWIFGLNNYSQLGESKEDLHYHPVKSQSFNGKKWVKMSGGEHHSIALDSEGCVYTVGRKEYGRLGLGKNCSDALKPTQVQIPEDTKCIDVACGSFTSFAITDDGKIYSWGMSQSQLGLGKDGDDICVPTVVGRTPNGKQLENRAVIGAAAGAQHTVIIITEKEPTV